MYLDFLKIHSIKITKLLQKLKLEEYKILMEVKENEEKTIRLSVFKNDNFYYCNYCSCYLKNVYLSQLSKNVKKNLLNLADEIKIRKRW